MAPQRIEVSIVLDKFNVQLQHKQLRAILKFVELAQRYQKVGGMQDKIRRFKYFRPLESLIDPIPGQRRKFDPKKWWGFAGECIKRSIRAKQGAFNAFKIPAADIPNLKSCFQSLFKPFFEASSDPDRVKVIKGWSKDSQAMFFYVL